MLMQVFEIHKYRGDEFMYIVARTNKHSEDYVRADVERMNNMLTPEMRAEGTRYAFALGTIESINRRTGERSRKKGRSAEEQVNLLS